ncbi:hypothetical protein OAF27_00055 [Verrucomicrobiales bacterium]|nr:hypothetical protein [Verrucomicrobiales bacterium]
MTVVTHIFIVNPYPIPPAASRIAAFRLKLAKAPVSKLTAVAFVSGVVGSLTLGILPDIFEAHLKRTSATAYERAEPGLPKVSKILPGGERVISVDAESAVMAFLHLESGDGVYLTSREAVKKTDDYPGSIPSGGRLSGQLPAALVAITPDTPLRIYNGSNEKAEVYISVTEANP